MLRNLVFSEFVVVRVVSGFWLFWWFGLTFCLFVFGISMMWVGFIWLRVAVIFVFWAWWVFELL